MTEQPIFDYPPDPPPQRPVNTLATLSLVFAFVFAPAGAILGHLGLAKMRRTGERGRRRALVAIALSYLFITGAVIGLVAWTTLDSNSVNQTAAPTTSTAAQRSTTSSVPSTTPPGPTVASNDIAKILADLAALKQITGDSSLRASKVWHQIARSDQDGTIDRPECYGAVAPGTPEAYDITDVLGFFAAAFTDIRNAGNILQVIQGAAALRDAPAAQAQLAKLQSQWRQCGGTSVKVRFTAGITATMALGVPTDAGDGITIMDQTTRGVAVHSYRAIATKANIVIDLVLSYAGTAITADPRQAIVDIANHILAQVP